MDLETIHKAAMSDPFAGWEDRILNAIEAAYSQGFYEGRELEHGIARSQAFGAIRRAAEVARRYDYVWMNATDPHWSFVDHYGASADAIRAAIRAAIGSDTR